MPKRITRTLIILRLRIHLSTEINQTRYLLEEIINYKEKIVEISSKDAVHQYGETIKAIANYVGQEYTLGGDISDMIKDFEDYNFVLPEDPPSNADQFKIESWKKQLDLSWKRRGIDMDYQMKIYSLIWG